MSRSNESHDRQAVHAHNEHPCCMRGKMAGQALPWTQRLRHTWLCWLLPIAGLLSLAWFLIRVIPKPSRALYPCQRVAMPLASGFVAWLIGVVGSVVAFRKAKELLRQSRPPLALACIAVGVVFGVMAVRNMPERQ